MKILLLSNNNNAQVLYDKLTRKGCDVTLYPNAIDVPFIESFQPDLVVSYNYRHIVKKDVIELLGKRIVNLHCSYLPWNKGASPNLWSFIENSPKGVTIHQLEAGLDTGKIIVQKEITFDEDTETLRTSYDRLNEEIVNLFMENIDIISSGEYEPIDQIGKGSYHTSAMLREFLDGESPNLDMTVTEFRKQIAEITK